MSIKVEFTNAHTVWTDVIVSGLYDEDENFQGILGVTRDITERKQAEDKRAHLFVQVREQAQRVQQIIDTVPEGVFVLDAERRVALANPVADGDLAVLADVRVGDVLAHLGGRPLDELLAPPPKGLWHEVSVERRDFKLIARPIIGDPDPESWVLVVRDTTRERDIQQRVQRQERLAAVGQLAAGIAHDFNNIMAVIVLYTQIALSASPNLSSKGRERLKTVSEQAKRATDLIQQILDFGRQSVIERLPLDLAPYLKELVKLLRRTVPEHIQIDAQVYGIVKQHEGEIDVASRAGQGTAFFRYFPALVEVLGEETLEEDLAAREALVDTLETLNYCAVAVANGTEALELLAQRDDVGLALSDVVMPKMGGIELFHSLQKTLPQLPVVLLTGHMVSKELKGLRGLGLKGWLTKPPDLEELARTLAQAVDAG